MFRDPLSYLDTWLRANPGLSSTSGRLINITATCPRLQVQTFMIGWRRPEDLTLRSRYFEMRNESEGKVWSKPWILRESWGGGGGGEALLLRIHRWQWTTASDPGIRAGWKENQLLKPAVIMKVVRTAGESHVLSVVVWMYWTTPGDLTPPPPPTRPPVGPSTNAAVTSVSGANEPNRLAAVCLETHRQDHGQLSRISTLDSAVLTPGGFLWISHVCFLYEI